MEIIDNQSQDGSPPPLSDGRASPAHDSRADLNELSGHGDLENLNDLGDHGEPTELNDLDAVTPPSSHVNSPVPMPDHVSKSLPFPPTATVHGNSSLSPSLNDRGTASVEGGAMTQDHSTQSATTAPLKLPLTAGVDNHSSTYPPSSSTATADHDAMTASEASSIPGRPPPAPQSQVMPTEDVTAAQRARFDGDVKKKPVDPKVKEIPVHKEPPGEVEVTVPVTSTPRPDLQAPDRRYHSRGRLDSLEDRNNLDTDSEMDRESTSGSEKESDTEDYPKLYTSRRHAKRSPPRAPSLSISSSDEEGDPFTEQKNDLSVVSSPEHELPPSGGFGVSLSLDADIVPNASPHEQRKEPPTSGDCDVRNSQPDVPQPLMLNTSLTNNLSDPGDKLEVHPSGENEEGAAPVEPVTTTDKHLKPRKDADDSLNDFSEPQHEVPEGIGGTMPQLRVRGERRTSAEGDEILQERPKELGRPESLLSGQDTNAEQYDNQTSIVLGVQSGQSQKKEIVPDITLSSESQSLNDLGQAPLPQHTKPIPHSEDEPMRTEPTHQVTRTSDQVIESASYSTSSSEQLQLPVRKSFSSLPAAYASPSLDRDYLLKPLDIESPPVSVSAPPTGLHMLLDQPPPPFTHYMAPPPIFRAHVLEQSGDPLFSTSVIEERNVYDMEDAQGGRESDMEGGDGEQFHSSAGMGMDYQTEQNQMEVSLSSLPVHPSFGDKSTGSQSHLVSSLENPPTVRIVCMCTCMCMCMSVYHGRSCRTYVIITMALYRSTSTQNCICREGLYTHQFQMTSLRQPTCHSELSN